MSGSFNLKHDVTVYLLAMGTPAVDGTDKAPNTVDFSSMFSTWRIDLKIRCRAMRVITMPNTVLFGGQDVEVEID